MVVISRIVVEPLVTVEDTVDAVVAIVAVDMIDSADTPFRAINRNDLFLNSLISSLYD